MKKLKLLSSLSALVLVLSLGACNGNKDDSATDEDSTDSSSEVSPVTVEDVTLSFSFVDATGAASTIPEYATAYVIGSWDGWSEFIPLTEKDGAYSTKFNELTVGSFTYKVVEWYTGESVSWSDCVEITTTDQTLTISEEDANSTISVTHTLSAVLDKLGVLEGEEAEEIIVKLLCAVNPAENGWIEDIWEGGHFEEEWLGDTDIIYMTLNDYGYEEGTWETIDEDGDTSVKYIVGGAVYNVVDGEFEFAYIYDDSYESLCDTYSYIVLGVYEELITSSVEYDDEGEEVSTSVELDKESIEEEGLAITIERTATGYILNVATESDDEDDGESDVITITTDRAFNLLAVEEVEIDSDGEKTSNFGEKITQADVEARLADFTTSVDYLVQDVVENCNYMMEVEYTEYYSPYYTEDELFDEDGVFHTPEGFGYYYYYFDCLFYVTEDAMLIYTGYDYGYFGFSTSFVELYVNDYENEKADVYFLSPYATTVYDLYYAGYYDGLYQDVFFTLQDLDGLSGEAILAGSTRSYYYNYELYDTNSYELANTLLGIAAYGYYYPSGYGFDYYVDGSDISYIQFLPDYGELMFGFDTGSVWYYTYLPYIDETTDDYMTDENGDYVYDMDTVWYFADWMTIEAEVWNAGSASIPEGFNTFLGIGDGE